MTLWKWVRSRTLLLICFTMQSALSDLPNPYHLITEKQIYPEKEIAAFWSRGEKGSFLGVDEIPIRYINFPNSVNRRAVVIVSGRTESYLKYQQVAYELAQLGYAVYLYDHRGQGFSGRLLADVQIGHVHHFSDYVEDLKQFYTLHIQPKNYQQTFILSHSMGGAIALLYILKYPKHMHGLVMLAPMLGLNFSSLICPLSKAIQTWERLFKLSPNYAPFQGPYDRPLFQENTPDMMTHSKTRYEKIHRDEQQFRQIQLGGVSSHWLAEACRAMQLIQQNSIKLTVPLLLLQASGDNVVSQSDQDQFWQQFSIEKQPQRVKEYSKKIVIEEAFHEILMEQDSYRIPAFTNILDFYKQLEQR